MPLTVTGEGYRTFSEPRFFEAETTAQVLLIRNPVNKAHALVAAADGSTGLAVWKFDSTSVAAVSVTVLKPLNPAFAAMGRWIFLSATTGTGGTHSGSGSPEGVVTASYGEVYWDYTNSIFYVKNSASGNTGWTELIAFATP